MITGDTVLYPGETIIAATKSDAEERFPQHHPPPVGKGFPKSFRNQSDSGPKTHRF